MIAKLPMVMDMMIDDVLFAMVVVLWRMQDLGILPRVLDHVL